MAAPQGETYRRFLEISSAVGFYPQQQKACREIIDAMLGTPPLGSHDSHGRYIMLAAQFQSGKTGVAKLVSLSTQMSKCSCLGINKILIISSDNRHSLKRQWEESVAGSEAALLGAIAPKLKDLSDKMDQDPSFWSQYKIVNELSDNIRSCVEVREVCFRGNSDFKKMKDLRNTLIIWDESDYGIGADGSFGQFIERMGWGGIRDGDFQALEEQNNYIMTITATRGAELAHSDLVKSATVIYMEPGANYCGLRRYVDNDKINPIEKDFSDFPSICEPFSGTKGIIIVRPGYSKNAIVRAECSRRNWECIELNQASREICHLTDWRKRTDSSPIVVILKNFWGRGDDLSLIGLDEGWQPGQFKNMISAWIETDVPSNHHTFLQRLARPFGYSPTSPDLYCPNGAKHPAITDYLERFENSAPDHMQMSGGHYIKKRRNYQSSTPKYEGHTEIQRISRSRAGGDTDEYSDILENIDDLINIVSHNEEKVNPEHTNRVVTTIAHYYMDKLDMSDSDKSQIIEWLGNPGHNTVLYRRLQTAKEDNARAEKFASALRGERKLNLEKAHPIIISFVEKSFRVQSGRKIKRGLYIQFAPKLRLCGLSPELQSENKTKKSLFNRAPDVHVEELQPENRCVDAYPADCSSIPDVLYRTLGARKADNLSSLAIAQGTRFPGVMNFKIELGGAYGRDLEDIKRLLTTGRFTDFGLIIKGKRGRSLEGYKNIVIEMPNL